MATLRRSVVSSVLFTFFGGPALVLVLIPWFITRFQVPPHLPLWHFVLGGLLIVAGLWPLGDSIVRFIVVGRGSLVPTVPTEHLVISGLYRYIRNPMYVGVAAAILGEWLILWHRGVFIEFVAVCGAFDLFVWFYEEPKLIKTYGDAYRRYREAVPRWFPEFKRWDG